MPDNAPYGTWRSPITAASIAEGGISIGAVAASGGRRYWSEQRSSEGGRTVIVRDGVDLTPEGYNARTAVHEYGGGAWWIHDDTVFFANWSDQRLYRQDGDGPPVAITPEPEIKRGLRYADGTVTNDGAFVICVRERHVEGREAFNEIVRIPADGKGEAEIIASGADFYSFPCLSPDDTQLAWTQWVHPNLPWDGTFLYLADADGSNATEIGGAMDESLFQPQWSPDGVLHIVTDQSGWWNIHNWEGPVVSTDADFGVPQWVFGQSTYTFMSNGDIVCAYERNATQRLGVIRDGKLTDLDLPYTSITGLSTDGDRVLCVVQTPTEHQAAVAIDPVTREVEVIKRARDIDVDPGYISVAEAIDFPSEGGRTSHALYYRPKNKDFEAPAGDKPPLIVWSHGGPTGVVRPVLSLNVQYWTSRGFAIVDVNYGGSVGYGRDYRRLLNGNWGVVDVEDCTAAATHLAGKGEADPERLMIRGGSAGGFTTLACLTFRDVFKAGANYFGVADFETFVGDTHKFESRYLDSLVGPYPERKDLYVSRSPTNFIDQITCPVITLQGLEDLIVPPSQSEQIVNALRAKGIPCAYITYEGEQHGFRKAETQIHAMESELYFYGKVFGFEPADELRPVEIENLP